MIELFHKHSPIERARHQITALPPPAREFSKVELSVEEVIRYIVRLPQGREVFIFYSST